MSEFTEILQELNKELKLPQPEKSRFILELSSDLNASMEYYIKSGLSRDQAVEKALETFGLTGDTADQLYRVHQSVIRRFSDRVSLQVQTRWEKVVFSIIFIFIMLFSGRELVNHEFLSKAGFFIWPLAVVNAMAWAIILWKTYILFLKQDHNVRELANGLSGILFCGLFSLFTGFYAAATYIFVFLSQVASNPGLAPKLFITTLLSIATMMMAALLTTIVIALVWFILMNRVSRIEEMEAISLLERS